MTLESSPGTPEKIQLLQLFPIPLLVYQMPDHRSFHGELRSAIMARKEQGIGVRSSNVGGWHSARDLQEWPEPSAQQLVRLIQDAVRELVQRTSSEPDEHLLTGWRIEAWANVNGCGSRNASHDHSQAGTLWSGIYYVNSGLESRTVEVSGVTKFEDRSGVPVARGDHRAKARDHAIQPRAGLMVLFPGRLWHRVEPFWGSSLRITIAFNLRHPDFVVPSSEPELSPAMAFMWRNFRGIMLPAQQLRHKLSALSGQ